MTNKLTIRVLFLFCVLQFISCKPDQHHTDLDEAVKIAKQNNKKLLFISVVNGCDPCDNLLIKVRDNDTIKAALKDYEIIVYSADLNNLSLANKITQNVNSPATFVFDEHQSLKNVVFGYKNVTAYIGKINQNSISDTEEQAFDKLLQIASVLKNDQVLEQSELVALKGFPSSLYSNYLLFKNSMLSKQDQQAMGYVQETKKVEGRLIAELYTNELAEMKMFKPNL